MTDGRYKLIWKDSGSGADEGVGLWANTNIEISDGIDTNAFTSISNYDTITGTPDILHSDYATLYTLIPITKKYQLDSLSRNGYG